MDALAAEGARYFLAQGVLGALAILFAGVIVYLYRDKDACQTKWAEAVERMARALERVSSTTAAHTVAMEARNRVLDDLVRLIAELSRIADSNDERSREKLGDIARRLEDIGRNIGAR